MSEKDKPELCRLKRALVPATQHFITAKPHGHLTEVIYLFIYLFFPSCPTVLVTPHQQLVTVFFSSCPRSGVFWGMSALLPVPVPEVGLCGLWERQRKCSARFSSVSLSLPLSLSAHAYLWRTLPGFPVPGFTRPGVMSSWISIKSPDSVLIKGPQMIVCVCACVGGNFWFFHAYI